jgi:hypothetical protein
VFATFSGLKQALGENKSQLYEALLSAKANTERLQYSLRALYHGIRGFLRGIALQRDVNLLLQDHFSEFKNMSDSIYHPIKTMDSIHRYMAPIQNLLSGMLADDELLQSMRERAANVRKYDDEAQADDEIVKTIDYIRDSYNSVGGLVSEIDRKHSAYTKSSIEKIQYFMAADQTIKGKLVEILKFYASAEDEKRDLLAEVMEGSIRAGRQEFFDARSLYHKNAKSRRASGEPLAVQQGGGFAELPDAHFLQHMGGGYSIANIRGFLDRIFADGGTEISSENIPLACDSDFILLILAVIRQNERGLPYTVDTSDGRVERNGYYIPNMKIRKKGAAAHVE